MTAPKKSSVSELHRDESKVGLILSQLAGVRARRNSLAVQHWVFGTVATLVVGAALVFAAAIKFDPIAFLLAAAIVAIIVIVTLVRVVRSALRMSSNMLAAAALADERGQLKDRLTTIATVAPQKRRSALWDYLIEDIFSLREEFTPSKVEPRRIERSIFAFLAACLIALLMLPMLTGYRPQPIAANGMVPPEQITADINNLVIRPADPALEPNARIFADQETLRALEQKLARSEKSQGGNGPMSKLMDRARNFADAFQDKLTGRQNSHMPPISMRLTDNHKSGGAHGTKPGGQSGSSKGNGGNGSRRPGANSGNQMAQGKQALPPLASLAPNQADQLADNNQSGTPGYQERQGNQNSPNDSSNPMLQPDQGSGGGGGGHGSGADPNSLFGKPSMQPLGSDSFKIAIDAQPSDESTSPGSPAYVPPKVRVPLNSTQYPDEPLARTSVPASDQMTIKRVFQR
ncbi:MAG: hypothetical protein ACREQN_04915 [Candidatus Binataceae bacterium]